MKRIPVTVTALGAGQYRVDVAASATTSHQVTLPADYLETLGLSALSAERVIEESFRFLLEREPNTAILRMFSLPVIERYFPTFRKEIALRLRS